MHTTYSQRTFLYRDEILPTRKQINNMVQESTEVEFHGNSNEKRIALNAEL